MKVRQEVEGPEPTRQRGGVRLRVGIECGMAGMRESVDVTGDKPTGERDDGEGRSRGGVERETTEREARLLTSAILTLSGGGLKAYCGDRGNWARV